MKRIVIYFLDLLVSASRNGNSVADYAVSIGSTVKLSIMLAPFVYIFDKLTNWGLHNQDYILIVMGAILTDWVFGTIKHIFITKKPNGKPTFSLKGNAIGLVTKIGLTAGGGFLFEGLSHLTADSELIVDTLKLITRIVVFMYPAISAWENIYIVSGERFPPKKWMDRLGLFQQSMDIKDLTDDKDNKRNNQ